MRKEAYSYNRGTPVDKLLTFWRVKVIQKYLILNSDVCDLGSGREGYFLKKIQDLIKSGVGLDVEPDMQFCNDKITFKKTDLNEEFPLVSESFDIVTSLAVIEHMENSRLFMSEANRILRKKGTLILTTPATYSRWVLELLCILHLVSADEVHDHKHYFSETELMQLVSRAGFLEIKIKKFQFSFNMLIIAKK